MKTINLICIFVNIILKPFVAFKIYSWYYDKVGFDLPELTFLNAFAISIILQIFFSNVYKTIRIETIFENTKKEEKYILGIAGAINYLIVLLSGYLLTFIY